MEDKLPKGMEYLIQYMENLMGLEDHKIVNIGDVVHSSVGRGMITNIKEGQLYVNAQAVTWARRDDGARWSYV